MIGNRIFINILYILIIIYFIYNYISNPQRFKFAILPLIVSSYLGIYGFFDNIDNRLTIFIYILVGISTIYYLYKYYSLYKIERYQAKLRLREGQEKERRAQLERLKKESELISQEENLKVNQEAPSQDSIDEDNMKD